MDNSIEARIKQALRDNLTVSFVEPGEDDQPVTVKVTAADAVKSVRDCIAAANKNIEMSDEDCLFDYIVIHWAAIDFPEEEG